MEQNPANIGLTLPEPEPYPPWGVAEAFAVWVAFIVIQIGLGAIAVFGYGLASGDVVKIIKHQPAGWILIAASMIGEIGALIFIVGMVKISYRLPFWKGIKWDGVSDKSKMALFAGIGVALANAFSTVLIPPPDVGTIPIYQMISTPRDLALFALFAIFVAPITEELIFRGWIFPAFRKRMRLATATILSAALFAAPHAAQLGEYSIGLLLVAFLGIVTALLREKSGGVKAPFICHTIYNTVLVAMEIVNRL